MFIAFIGITLSAQNSKSATVTIKTNGVCKMCEDRFNEKVPYFKGVQDFSYDLTSNNMVITYNPNKTNPDELRKQVSNLGYDADAVKANPTAREKLPACCKAPKSEHHHHDGCSGHGHKH